MHLHTSAFPQTEEPHLYKIKHYLSGALIEEHHSGCYVQEYFYTEIAALTTGGRKSTKIY